MSDRDRYLALVYNGPLTGADAIALLAGEDAAPRAEVAYGLFTRNAAPLLYVTGCETREHRTGAEEVVVQMLAKGVAPERIKVDTTARNTWDQARHIVDAATALQWNRALLVASAYHVPRAMLTVIKALADAGLTERVCVVPVPASHAPWFEPPAGMAETRADLLGVDLSKIDTYAALGHCATFADGIAYLRFWEGK